ncbi:MAG: hypothetical protein M1503_07175 [Thaumarchaeota archaeon]|nr:hypothetical protein [Nitrososphaerota archaeon]MCL5318023.1 hypothetical protein [Nitrososphaerota archaeon]
MTPTNRLVKAGVEKRVHSNSAGLPILRRLAITVAFVLIVGSTVSPFAVPAFGDNHEEVKRQAKGDRVSVSNNAITLVVVAGGKHPEFFWYANNDSKQVYKVQFKGITEYLDFGQKIYQRRLNAEVKDQIENRSVDIKSLNASKAGTTVLALGTLRENKNQGTQKIYSYVLTQSGAEIGVSVSNSTVVQGELKGAVIVRGTVRTSGNVTYLEAKNIISIDRLEKELSRVHPTFFEFNEAKWNFSGFQPIKSGNTTIGYQFSFISQDIKNPKFSYLEGQLEIRGRVYSTTVKEGNVTVTSASVKTDIIIKSWKWNLNSTIARILNLNMTKDKLALWVDMTAYNANKSEDAISGKANASTTEIETGDHDQKIDTRSHGEAVGQDEKELKVKGSETRLTFANETKSLGGYFNFTNYAYVYTNASAPTKGEKVPVTAAYLPDGRHLRLFLLYPNFGNKSLEHDPTMGVDVAGVSTTPLYSVDIDSGVAQPATSTPTQTTTTSTTTSTSSKLTSTTTTTSSTITSSTSSLSSSTTTSSAPTTISTTSTSSSPTTTTTTTLGGSSTTAVTTQTSQTSESTGLPVEVMYGAVVAVIAVMAVVALALRRRANNQ